MNERFVRHFFTTMALVVIGFVLFQAFYDYASSPSPGDYQVRQGQHRLTEGRYEEALARFDEALARRPNHRGAWIGRALVFIQTERYEEAQAELTALIDHLHENLESDDAQGWGTLAAAYANRGLVHDRREDYRLALEDYLRALRVDEGSLGGPPLLDGIIYGYQASTVRERVRQLYTQFQLPEEDRLIVLPEGNGPKERGGGAR